MLWNLFVMTVYAFFGIFLMYTGYKIFDLLTPKINFAHELVENKNISVGIVIGSIIMSVGAIVVAVIVS